MIKVFSLIFISFLISCSSAPVSELDVAPAALNQGQYESLIKKYTRSDKRYSGLYNKYHVSATLLNSQVQGAIDDRLRFYKQLNDQDYESEREASQQRLSSQSLVFLSFYSPEKDYRKLHRPNSLWKIYVEYNGQKYPGRIKKDKEKELQLKKLFPHHSRWSSPYIVTFNVPMTSLEEGKATLILSSSAGKSVLEFPSAN